MNKQPREAAMQPRHRDRDVGGTRRRPWPRLCYRRVVGPLAAVALGVALLPLPPARGQEAPPLPEEIDGELTHFDFPNVELSVLIKFIAEKTGKNFIYDDQVRGRVTIVSPNRVSIDEAYRTFESVLRVKGFTTVETPGGILKVIPMRDAKQTNIDTRSKERGVPQSDRFITRLIPLAYIDAPAIADTLRPLVSNDAALIAYPPTNTLILIDSASNIRRILSIIDEIDVEVYREELAVIRLRHANAANLATRLGEIFGGVGNAPPGQLPLSATRSQVRILTDERTNALIALASRSDLDQLRDMVRQLDVPISGAGSIHVYYLKHADAEELVDTLNNLISGGGAGGAATPQQLQAAALDLASGVTSLTSDPATNALVIQASPGGFEVLSRVIERLDIARRQVLVEALILEVDVTDSVRLGFQGALRIINGDTDLAFQTLTSFAGATAVGGLITNPGENPPQIVGNAIRDQTAGGTQSGTLIQGIIAASHTDNSINILSAPHILTSDNEEAEIVVGDNIPIIRGQRVQAATGVQDSNQLATAVNVERQDIGVTLRVTPQISEGETLRLELYQEISDINSGLVVGDPNQVGVGLSNRRIDNTVVVNGGDTVVIGGLISDNYTDTVTKVPLLGDIPWLGHLFKSTNRRLRKLNLLIFLTPHIVRNPLDLERQSIRKREEFRKRSEPSSEDEDGEDGAETEDPADDGEAAGADSGVSVLTGSGDHPTYGVMRRLERRYPLERLQELEEAAKRSAAEAAGEIPQTEPGAPFSITAGSYGDEATAQEMMVRLNDAGYTGELITRRVADAEFFELRVGPFEKWTEAQRAAEVLRTAHQLEPEIVASPAPAAQPERAPEE